MPRTLLALVSLIALLSPVPLALAADEAPPLSGFAPGRVAAQRAYEAGLRDAVDPERLAAWHEMTSSRPHVAGSPGDAALVAALAGAMAEMGLAVEKQELWLYLPHFVAAEVEVVAPQRVVLDLQEDALPEDPYSAHSELLPGWNAYSGSGEATAGVVYANRGTKEDFARLAELGVEVAGKIVVARYGGNFRGYKAKFAEQAGAAGLIMYLDPEDYGYVRGLMWPEGGWANGSMIQRGALLTLPYPGDPLTPGVAAVAPPGEGGGPPTGDGRLAPEAVAMPAIPVQPIGWRAASEVLSRMHGPAVPDEWQGALPFNYRLTGGDDLVVRLRVEQERKLTRTWNVVGTLAGERLPDQEVVVGCHHDAWSFGAGDPNAGTMLVLEAARAFSAAAAAGRRPDRTLVFAHWGAEEQGIQGSVEWVEAHAERLRANAVAYLNLDMAAMGPRFGGSASPPLARPIREAARAVASPVDGAGTVYDEWAARGDGGAAEPRLGALGGGSDHVGFYGHLGVPSASMGGGGSDGVSYHSNYEDLAWYRAVVGDDYAPARMLTQMVVTFLARFAEADLLPLEPAAYGDGAAERLQALVRQAGDGERRGALERLAAAASAAAERWRTVEQAAAGRLAAGALDAAAVEAANRELRAADRAWVSRRGLPGRPWYRNLYAAPDADSGYAPWLLPGLTAVIEDEGDQEAFDAALHDYRQALARLTESAESFAAATNEP